MAWTLSSTYNTTFGGSAIEGQADYVFTGQMVAQARLLAAVRQGLCRAALLRNAPLWHVGAALPEMLPRMQTPLHPVPRHLAVLQVAILHYHV